MLASTLVHELVHALYWERQRKAVEEGRLILKAFIEEPYFEARDAQREVEEAWERWVFWRGGGYEV